MNYYTGDTFIATGFVYAPFHPPIYLTQDDTSNRMYDSLLIAPRKGYWYVDEDGELKQFWWGHNMVYGSLLLTQQSKTKFKHQMHL